MQFCFSFEKGKMRLQLLGSAYINFIHLFFVWFFLRIMYKNELLNFELYLEFEVELKLRFLAML